MTQLRLMTWLLGPFVLLFATSCAIPKYEASTVFLRKSVSEGKIKEALAFYESQALDVEKRAATSWLPQQNWADAVDAYRAAAQAARYSGQLQKSITLGEKALDIAQRTKVSVSGQVNLSYLAHPPEPELTIISILIPAYESIRNFDRARALIENGLTKVKDLPPNTEPRMRTEASLYHALGRDLIRRREYDKAVDSYSQAVYLWQSLMAGYYSRSIVEKDSQASFVGLLAGLGNAYRLAGRLHDALEQYQRAFDYVKKGASTYAFEYVLYQGLGEVRFREKNFSQALQSFQKALALAEKRRIPDAIRSASARIGDVLSQTGKPAEAVAYYQRAIQQVESTRSLLESEEYRQSYFEGALGPYISLIQALLSAGKRDEAFNYSERARSRTFLDVLGTRVQLSRAKGGLLEEEKSLQERIAGLNARLVVGADEEDGETDRAGLRKQLAEAEKAYSTFLTKVRKQNKEQASLMAVEPLTLKEVQELLDPGTTLIEYFVTQSDILVWVVEKDKLQIVTVDLAKGKLSGLVKSLRENIFALGEKSKFDEVSISLYKQLIQPILPHITGKELIIVPHDVLHYLPFHALVGSDGKYLIEKYPIYYLSSASLLQFTKEKRRASGGKVLAFGNPDLGDPQKDLEFAELEAQEVKAVYPGSTVFLRKEATEEKAKGLSPSNDILHFATHAELNEDDPLSSAVLLAKSDKEDGRLEVREIFGMDLKANLVVLSGCETGLGKLSTGDELVGLTRAFIYAGTPSVVASLWNVEDSSTAQLMASFYKNLKTMSKVEALRQAQLQLIRGEVRSDLLARRGIGGVGKLGETPSVQLPAPSSVLPAPISVTTSHPYFWAPFILVGDGK